MYKKIHGFLRCILAVLVVLIFLMIGMAVFSGCRKGENSVFEESPGASGKELAESRHAALQEESADAEHGGVGNRSGASGADSAGDARTADAGGRGDGRAAGDDAADLAGAGREGAREYIKTYDEASGDNTRSAVLSWTPGLLPEIVSTASNAALVEKTYRLEPGSVVEEKMVKELGEDAFFVQMMINDDLFSRMDGKSYKEGCAVPVSDLRYLRLLHYDLNGKIHVGELVCNKSISDDVLTIFHKLYDARYPIEQMILPDEYEDADILLSSGDNNTAAFNDRNTVGKTTKSLHARGIAIDINPLYNPYIMYQPDGSYRVAPENGIAYANRRGDFPYKIDRNDLCYRLFTEAGFTWGGIWNNPDYMHFFRK